jgi:hypothetical protein
MKTTKTSNRRNFLLAAGMGTAGVAAAVVTAGRKPVVKAEADAVDEQPSGYRESDHIRKYYKTAKV